MCRSLLVAALLKCPGEMAAVVDTTGNFDVMRLYTLILAQLQKSAEVLERVRVATKSGGVDAVGDIAAKVLDQVKIMRVFDFIGVREAIGEIREDLEARKRPSRPRPHEESVPKAKEPTPETQVLPKRTVVADSEDEDDEDMLFDSSTPTAAPEAEAEPAPAVQQQEPDAAPVELQEAGSDLPSSKVKFILIDNLAQVINPLLKKDYVKGHTVLPCLPSRTLLT